MDSQAPYSSIFENYDLYSEPAASTFPLPEVSLASTEMNLDAGSSPFRTHGPRAQPATGPSSSFQEGDLQVPYATPSPFRSDLLDIQPTHTLSPSQCTNFRFTRFQDLERHYKTVHFRHPEWCAHPDCELNHAADTLDHRGGEIFTAQGKRLMAHVQSPAQVFWCPVEGCERSNTARGQKRGFPGGDGRDDHMRKMHKHEGY
ncbi:hypothetical protein AOQ84DRAFT_226802 [Glonium stellatum]|uniref:C2H2-type domain-containing protein n=1 Tax=Glonium stellatum TaxID=574774 RepID=A0A8E2JP31_9PEZI|nr:hypothetical protein AOQ84DRAFT_226802 [Glonium stellatum]